MLNFNIYCNSVDTPFFTLPNISVAIPKGKYTIAFCDDCFYLDSTSKQLRIDYTKQNLQYSFYCSIREVINVGSTDVKTNTNVVISLSLPIEVFFNPTSDLDWKTKIRLLMPAFRYFTTTRV